VHANRWDAFTTAELKVLAAWAYEFDENRELDTRDLRRELRNEIDRRQVEAFGERVQSSEPAAERATPRHAN
jgi:hypothetical protein